MEHDPVHATPPPGAACAEVLLDVASPIADRPLTYRVPPPLGACVRVGVRVRVPLGRRIAHGFVLGVGPCPPMGDRALRDLLDVPDPTPLFSEALLELARTVARQTLATLLDAVRCLVPAEVARATRRCGPRVAILVDGAAGARRPGRRQRALLAALAAAPDGLPVAELVRAGGRASLRRLVAAGAVRLADAPPASLRDCAARGESRPERGAAPAPAGQPVLLWGDAEARRRWIAAAASAAVASGRQALITVPEIAQASDLASRLRLAGGMRVALFHSDLPPSQRRATWREIHGGAADAVVGTRSALWVPLSRLGLIVVEDEHDPSYKADAAPRYHARTVALARGQIEGARVVLGTQTPSVEAYAAAAAGQMECTRLEPAAAGPRVVIVDTRDGRGSRRRGLLAQPLIDAIRRHLRAGGRIALFVNRVGYARVLLCRECGAAVRCARCDIPMAYDRGATLRCRVCGRAGPAPDVCPRCRGVALWWLGAGTARVQEVVRRVFPSVRTARVDRETAREFDTVAQEFATGRVRLLVGTQLLLRARRLRPTLVGVIDADAALYLPDFRAAERALQQLRAVLSLAAGPPDPEAVVQTRVPEHPVIAALRTGEDERVYEEELRVRRELGYPPYAHLARLVATARSREVAAELAARAGAIARERGVEVLGPAPALDAGGRAWFRVQCVLRAPTAEAVREAARAALAGAGGAGAARGRPRDRRLTVDLDPQEMC